MMSRSYQLNSWPTLGMAWVSRLHASHMQEPFECCQVFDMIDTLGLLDAILQHLWPIVSMSSNQPSVMNHLHDFYRFMESNAPQQ